MTLLSLSLTLAAPTAAASPDRLDEALTEAKVTDAQRTEIHTIVEGARDDREALREEVRALRDRASDLFLAEDLDRKQIESVRKDMVDWFDRASSLAVDTWVAVAEQLDPEQRAILQARRRSRVERVRAVLGWPAAGEHETPPVR